jgi:hypothetical protein
MRDTLKVKDEGVYSTFKEEGGSTMRRVFISG